MEYTYNDFLTISLYLFNFYFTLLIIWISIVRNLSIFRR